MESKKKLNFDEVIGDDLIEINVKDLLDGVDLAGARRVAHKGESMRKPLRLFYSYSHKDEIFREELETHLKLFQRQGLIESWHDRRIEAGEKWEGEIDGNLKRADIIVILVSSDFIASDYCYESELKLVLERHNKGEASLIPVIIRDVSWRTAPFGKIQALPKDGKAVSTWSDRDTAWRNVAEGIEWVIKKLKKRTGQREKS